MVGLVLYSIHATAELTKNLGYYVHYCDKWVDYSLVFITFAAKLIKTYSMSALFTVITIVLSIIIYYTIDIIRYRRKQAKKKAAPAEKPMLDDISYIREIKRHSFFGTPDAMKLAKPIKTE